MHLAIQGTILASERRSGYITDQIIEAHGEELMP
jgi:hypothetical protein